MNAPPEFAEVYAGLRRLAAARLASEAPGQTLDATALVHEAYLRIFAAHPARDLPPGGPTATFGDSVGTEDRTPGPGAGTIIAGKYKLIEEIGEGGMGSVWMAHQTEPVKRFVAVKLIKAGMDSKAVLARFEAERQAPALMDHPNIARVLDAPGCRASRTHRRSGPAGELPLCRPAR